MLDMKTAPIHIFYNAEYPNGYTTANNNREASRVAVELMHRTGSPVSVFGHSKHWRTGKYASYIVKIEQPFRSQLSGGYVVHPVIS